MYDYAKYDNKGAAPGTMALWKVIESAWPSSKFLGIYANRSIRGSDTLSLHAEGRAVDFIPPSSKRDTIAEWAKEHAQQLGIQEVIVYETKKYGQRQSPMKDGDRTKDRQQVCTIFTSANIAKVLVSAVGSSMLPYSYKRHKIYWKIQRDCAGMKPQVC